MLNVILKMPLFGCTRTCIKKNYGKFSLFKFIGCRTAC